MKIDSWEDIPKEFPKWLDYTPLAYYDKDVTHDPNNFKSVVFFEIDNKPYIGYSNGDITNVPFNLKALMNELNELKKLKDLKKCPKS